MLVNDAWLNPLLVINRGYRFQHSPADVAAAWDFIGPVEAPDKESLARAVVVRVHERMRIRPSAFSLGMPKSLRGIVAVEGGNCVAHSVVATVLLRDLGIPARLVSENVYTNASLLRLPTALVRAPIGPTLNSHVWVEVCVDGEWVPADAELGIFGFTEWCAARLVHGTTLRALGLPFPEHWKFPLRIGRLGPDGQLYEDVTALFLVDGLGRMLGPGNPLPPGWVEGVHYFSGTFRWDGWAGLRILKERRRLQRMYHALGTMAEKLAV